MQISRKFAGQLLFFCNGFKATQDVKTCLTWLQAKYLRGYPIFNRTPTLTMLTMLSSCCSAWVWAKPTRISCLLEFENLFDIHRAFKTSCFWLKGCFQSQSQLLSGIPDLFHYFTPTQWEIGFAFRARFRLFVSLCLRFLCCPRTATV